MENKILLLILKMTKFTLYGFLFQMLMLNAVIAHKLEAQKIAEVYVKVSFDDEMLIKVLDEIESQSGFHFTIHENEAYLKMKVSVKSPNISIEDLLIIIGRQTGLSFQQVNSNISIRLRDVKLVAPLIESVTADEKIRIGGVVNDEYGDPMPGVTILESNTNNGVVTDIEGRYAIEVEVGARLVFNYIGYDRQSFDIGSQSVLNVTMVPDQQALEEVVVIGYGSVKKEDLTGSVAQVKVSELQDIPANSIERLLQGRAAGLQVSTPSQDPGSGSTVRIRGGSSLEGSNSPLIVVDGFPLGDAGDLMQVNPADIESVEVLKDASASAIYGSRGSNGVIIISTRRAKAGQTKFMIRQQSTVSEFTSDLNLWRHPELMAQLNNEGRTNGGFQPLFIGEVSPSGIYYPSVQELSDGSWPHNTRWDDIVFRDAPISNNTTFTVSSANEKTSFNLSAAYFTDKGVQIKDDFSKLNVNMNIGHQVLDNLKITFQTILTRGSRNANGGLAYWRNPIWPVYDETGDYYLLNDVDFDHPLGTSENRKDQSRTIDVLNFLDVEWEVIPSITINSRLNYKYGGSINDVYQPRRFTQTGQFNNGAAFINNWQGNTFVSETFANYRKVNNKHDLATTIGYSYQYDQVRTTSLGAYDFVNETLNNENMGAGNPELNTVGNGLVASELVSGIFRVNYSYDNKYLMTFTSRTDGSSKFGENNKWAFFPSGALSWKAHEEDFIRRLNTFDQLKFRVSYGISGNQGISPYQTLSRYGISKYYNDGNWITSIGPGIEVGRAGQGGIEVLWGGIPNPDLRWETTGQIDFGVDFAVFDGKLNVTFDYYEKNTKDLLQERILPLSSGYDRMWINNGSITNKGIELTLGGDIINKQDFNLNGTFIFSRNRNQVTDLGDPEQSGLIVDANTGMQFQYAGNSMEMYRGYPNLLAVGQPINIFYGYVTDGIIQSLEEGISAGLRGEQARPGEFKYVDINGDGLIDEEDRTLIGDPNPNFLASINLAMTYKRFDASIFFNGVFGNDVINTQAFNQPSIMPLRWTPDNPTNEYPSLKDGRLTRFSDWWIEDGSFVRIQNASLGYNFSLAQNMSLRVFANGSNLFTFTKFKGYDPEVGLDGRFWGGYPRIRQWTGGINLTF